MACRICGKEGGYECPECDCDYCKEHYAMYVKKPGTYDTWDGARCSRCGDEY